jgi:N-acyl homoserine lactone hydrolase
MSRAGERHRTGGARTRVSAVEIVPLRLAELRLPEFHPEAPGTDTVYGFLVRDRDESVLVDTGIGIGNRWIDRWYEPRRFELSAALRGVGASLGDVIAVVNTHLHFDHCGGNSLLPGVPIFVQQAELEAARSRHYTVRSWVEFPGANYVPVRGAHAISEHLTVIPTPGHTPGHQSLLVESRSERDLVVGQAAYTAAEFQSFAEHAANRADDGSLDRYVQSNATWSAQAYVASLGQLRRARPDRAYFSHDPTVWKRAV